MMVATSASLRPEMIRWAGSWHAASYSRASATESSKSNWRVRARSISAAEAPAGLRRPATMTLVSNARRIISYTI